MLLLSLLVILHAALHKNIKINQEKKKTVSEVALTVTLSELHHLMLSTIFFL